MRKWALLGGVLALPMALALLAMTKLADSLSATSSGLARPWNDFRRKP